MIGCREYGLAALLLAAATACKGSDGSAGETPRPGAGGAASSGADSGDGGDLAAGGFAGDVGWCPNAAEWFGVGVALCDSQWVVLARAGDGDFAQCETSVQFPEGELDGVSLNHTVLAVDCEPVPPCSQRDEDCWGLDVGVPLTVTFDEVLCARLRENQFERIDFVAACSSSDP